MGRRSNRKRFSQTFLRVLACVTFLFFAHPLCWHTPPVEQHKDPSLALHRQEESNIFRQIRLKHERIEALRANAKKNSQSDTRVERNGRVRTLRVTQDDSPPEAEGESVPDASEKGDSDDERGSDDEVPSSMNEEVSEDGKKKSSLKTDDDEANPPSEVEADESDLPEDRFLARSPYKTVDERIAATVDKKHWGPEATDAEDLLRATHCDIYTVPFVPKADDACVESLRDLSRWRSLTPVDQKFDERTIKFKVDIVDPTVDGSPGVKAIVKVPQRLYPTEPYSEVLVFHSDRIMEVNRVPPTGLVCIPLDWLVVAALDKGRKMQLVKQFAKDSSVDDYAGWLRRDLIQFVSQKGIADDFEHSAKRFAAKMPDDDLARFMESHGGSQIGDAASKERSNGVLEGIPEGLCVHASVQLFVAEAAHFLDSVYAIPYRAHDPSWHKYFAPAAKYYPPADKDLNVSFAHMSEIVSLDFVLMNSDRSPNKNNFVVGGCRTRCPKYKRHPGAPTFVHLDNGLAFHYAPENPISKKGAHDPSDPSHSSFCWFYAPLVRTFRNIVSSAKPFAERLLASAPDVAVEHVGEKRIRQVDVKMNEFLGQVDHCASRWPLEVVMHA